jgi:hypothetical protein
VQKVARAHRRDNVLDLAGLAQISGMPTDTSVSRSCAGAVHGMDFAILKEEATEAMSANETRRAGDQNPNHAWKFGQSLS